MSEQAEKQVNNAMSNSNPLIRQKNSV